MRKAFTLIEILIVVILLAILAAIVVPMFTDVTDEAQASAKATDISAIRSALELYRARAGDFPPALANLEGTFTGTAPDGTTTTYGPFLEQIGLDPTDGAAYEYTYGSTTSYTLEGTTYGT